METKITIESLKTNPGWIFIDENYNGANFIENMELCQLPPMESFSKWKRYALGVRVGIGGAVVMIGDTEAEQLRFANITTLEELEFLQRIMNEPIKNILAELK